MSFTLPKLPYEYDSLEPFIDARTMQIHYEKHHQTYVDKLNAAVKGIKFENMEINEILKNIDDVPSSIKTAVINHGGGHSNHSLFWQILIPAAETQEKPEGIILEAIENHFESFEKFKEQFTNAAINRFGSGWAWLVVNQDLELEIISTANQDSPLMDNKTPILCLDIWEHAYYLKYQNKRADYISAWWNIISWKKVSELFDEVNNK
ncbi:superoxide dismutase [Candidatus Pacearchaeota archaeon]|nr:superoxide dismutase [Candidatus Pacearchaeota archaeon]